MRIRIRKGAGRTLETPGSTCDLIPHSKEGHSSREIDTTLMVKIFKCAERSRSSMMDVEDEHNHMRAAFGLRYRIGKPGTPAADEYLLAENRILKARLQPGWRL